MLFVFQHFHLLLRRKSKELFALLESLVRDFFAYSVVYNVEKSTIQTCLKQETPQIKSLVSYKIKKVVTKINGCTPS